MLGSGKEDNKIWISRNVGSQNPQFQSFEFDGEVDFFEWHPKDKSKALLLIKTKTNPELKNLYLTRDMGLSWHKMLEKVKNARWALPQGGNYHHSMLFGIMEAQIGWGQVPKSYFFQYNVDTTHRELKLDNAVEFFSADKFLLVATIVGKEVSIYVSKDNGGEFKKMMFPIKDLSQKVSFGVNEKLKL